MKLQVRSGKKAVTTAGTRVRLVASSLWARCVFVKAPAANSGNVFLGDNTVSSTVGYLMAPGDSVSLSQLMGNSFTDLHTVDLTDVWLDAATNGDSVTFLYFDQVL